MSSENLETRVEVLHNKIALDTADVSSWLELAEIHRAAGNLQQAVFCAEEAILLKPHEPALHSNVAEMFYQLGGNENFRSARKHYCQSLELCDTKNVDAVKGLYRVCKKLQKAGGQSSEDANRNDRLMKLSETLAEKLGVRLNESED